MATIIIALIFIAGIGWISMRAVRWVTGYRPPAILKLEARYWRAREIGDISDADQIEAQLRDTPGSGWGTVSRRR